MVKVKEDLTERQFGRLTVICQAEDYVAPSTGKHYARWLCECSCDEHNRVIADSVSLKNGKTVSCGCVKKEKAAQHCKDMRKTNTYDLSGRYGIGWTSNTNQEFYFDLEDYDAIKNYCWSEKIYSDGYRVLCSRDKNGKIVKMTSLLGFKYYDHEDRNPLNNRKSNLRLATSSDNMSNRSVFKNNKSGITGVWWDKKRNYWRAYIRKDNKQYHLGIFVSKQDAIIARLRAEIKYFGKFAPQKHLFEKYKLKDEFLEMLGE